MRPEATLQRRGDILLAAERNSRAPWRRLRSTLRCRLAAGTFFTCLLTLLAFLVQKYKLLVYEALSCRLAAGTHFACFPSTKVQILMPL
jgi:hypothetical protein